MYYQIKYKSPVGIMMVVCDGQQKHITGLWIEGQKYFQATLRQEPIPGEDISVLQKAANWQEKNRRYRIFLLRRRAENSDRMCGRSSARFPTGA